MPDKGTSDGTKDRPRRKLKLSRRTFFVASGATGAAGLAVGSVAAPPAPKHPSSRTGGYRETEHVRTVYRLARF